MIADAVMFAATRATGHAAEKMARTAGWFAMAAVMLVLAVVFAVTALYWYLAPWLGPITAALAIAAGAMLTAIVFVSVPSLMAAIETSAQESKPTVATAMAAVDTEAHAAVDYFGAARVLLSAFVFGISAARTIRQR
jgi:hypothetical protein